MISSFPTRSFFMLRYSVILTTPDGLHEFDLCRADGDERTWRDLAWIEAARLGLIPRHRASALEGVTLDLSALAQQDPSDRRPAGSGKRPCRGC